MKIIKTILIISILIMTSQVSNAKSICTVYIHEDKSRPQDEQEMNTYIKREIRKLNDVEIVYDKNYAGYYILCTIRNVTSNNLVIGKAMGCSTLEKNLDYFTNRSQLSVLSKVYIKKDWAKSTPEILFTPMSVSVWVGKDIQDVAEQYIIKLDEELFEKIRKHQSKSKYKSDMNNK